MVRLRVSAWWPPVGRRLAGGAASLALWIGEVTGRPVPRFEKVEREPPADGIVIEGDDL
jgi:hypothetical protein